MDLSGFDLMMQAHEGLSVRPKDPMMMAIHWWAWRRNLFLLPVKTVVISSAIKITLVGKDNDDLTEVLPDNLGWDEATKCYHLKYRLPETVSHYNMRIYDRGNNLNVVFGRDEADEASKAILEAKDWKPTKERIAAMTEALDKMLEAFQEIS